MAKIITELEGEVHASGHCSREELREVIEKIKPKRLFPIHTENPLEFKDIAKNVEIKMG